MFAVRQDSLADQSTHQLKKFTIKKSPYPLFNHQKIPLKINLQNIPVLSQKINFSHLLPFIAPHIVKTPILSQKSALKLQKLITNFFKNHPPIITFFLLYRHFSDNTFLAQKLQKCSHFHFKCSPNIFHINIPL